MKNTLLFLTMLTVLVSTNVTSAHATAQVAYPAELAYYDAQINVLLPRLDDFQYQYYVANGRYYQALASHTTAPDVPTIPDAIQSSPTDQEETLAYFWEVFAALPDQLAWSFSLDTYSGPDGEGYVLNVETSVDGVTWMRSINYGPDVSRNVEWFAVLSNPKGE